VLSRDVAAHPRAGWRGVAMRIAGGPIVRLAVTASALAAAATWGGHLGAAAPQASAPPAGSSAPPAAYRAMLGTYCVGCHNQRVKTADVAFDAAGLDNVGAHAELWEKAIRKLRAGMMPPPGAPRPGPALAQGFAAWLETSLDQAAA